MQEKHHVMSEVRDGQGGRNDDIGINEITLKENGQCKEPEDFKALVDYTESKA